MNGEKFVSGMKAMKQDMTDNGVTEYERDPEYVKGFIHACDEAIFFFSAMNAALSVDGVEEFDEYDEEDTFDIVGEDFEDVVED